MTASKQMTAAQLLKAFNADVWKGDPLSTKDRFIRWVEENGAEASRMLDIPAEEFEGPARFRDKLQATAREVKTLRARTLHQRNKTAARELEDSLFTIPDRFGKKVSLPFDLVTARNLTVGVTHVIFHLPEAAEIWVQAKRIHDIAKLPKKTRDGMRASVSEEGLVFEFGKKSYVRLLDGKAFEARCTEGEDGRCYVDRKRTTTVDLREAW